MAAEPTLREQLFHEILRARQRVYAIGEPTPLERLELPIDAEVWLKREDLSPIKAYKWRGAYNRMAVLDAEQRARGVICASAGNHGQGVALAARRLGVHAKVFMPLSTPTMKRRAVERHGGEAVEIVMVGDTYDAASQAANAAAASEGRVFVHPYDDLLTMAGQGTLADEVVMSGRGPFDLAYLQIGGGGLAAGVSCWLKSQYPDIELVGVEGRDQASMAAALSAGTPVELDYVDVFCDGTAVRRVGALTQKVCAELLDDMVTVSNEEVCAAVQLMWETRRCIPEPSGAMGLAALMQDPERARGKRVLCILCGANMDFAQLGFIARHAGIGAHRRVYLRFELGERQGALLDLLEGPLNTREEALNIFEFQYGKTGEEIGRPVIGLEASPELLGRLQQQLEAAGVPHEDVTGEADVEFRLIHYEASLIAHPLFFTLEFPERPGALHDFLAAQAASGNLCYFNYGYTGERVGRALLGFEFPSEEARTQFLAALQHSSWVFQEVSPEVMSRTL